MKKFTYVVGNIEVAHRLPDGFGVKAMHGHSYQIKATFDTEGATSCFLLKERLDAVLSVYDHTILNDTLGDDPTMENLAEVVLKRLKNEMCVSVEVFRPTIGFGAIACTV